MKQVARVVLGDVTGDALTVSFDELADEVVADVGDVRFAIRPNLVPVVTAALESAAKELDRVRRNMGLKVGGD